ncbi:hypothetical protein pb186bvf_015182 [Paramecium bursaria]
MFFQIHILFKEKHQEYNLQEFSKQTLWFYFILFSF